MQFEYDGLIVIVTFKRNRYNDLIISTITVYDKEGNELPASTEIELAAEFELALNYNKLLKGKV